MIMDDFYQQTTADVIVTLLVVLNFVLNVLKLCKSKVRSQNDKLVVPAIKVDPEAVPVPAELTSHSNETGKTIIITLYSVYRSNPS